MSPSSRPTKRARASTGETPTSTTRSSDDMEQQQQQQQHSTSSGRARGPAACERCRDRKTKCDFQRPVCGYCSKRQVSCVYPEDAVSCAVSGADILAAINDLSRLVESQGVAHAHAARASSSVAYGHHSTHDISSPASHTFTMGQTPTSQPAWPGPSTSTSFEPPSEGGSGTQGLDSILQWDVFEPLRPTPCLFAETSADPGATLLPADTLPPPLRYTDLLRLETKYVRGIHDKNPFLDLAEVRRLVLNVAENGPDWSTQTCLVALVCAVGAINQSYPSPGDNLAVDPSLGPPEEDADRRLSLQFWNMAAKRLGLAIGHNDVRSVQCLCLAGIWYMHNFQPLEAWKHFSLAASAWHCLRLTSPTGDIPGSSGASPSARSLTVSQALYFTIWKSECELMVELPLPSRDLDLSRFPHAFPTPPTPGAEPATHADEVGEDERCWYYYLAEIAARHLLNRLVRGGSELPAIITPRVVRRMLRDAELMEAQIHDWHVSLPPFFRFDAPAGYSLGPHPDDMTQILRNRYLNLREIVARRFVRLCVEHPLDCLDSSTAASVIAFAHQSLRLCMVKLSQVRPHRHQGIWFFLRNLASSSLVLKSVDLAKRKPWPVGAHALVLPEGWRERIDQAREKVGVFWDEPHGGAAAIRRVLEAGLEEET